MTVLLDANVLIALIRDAHVHHDAASRWFAAFDHGLAKLHADVAELVPVP